MQALKASTHRATSSAVMTCRRRWSAACLRSGVGTHADRRRRSERDLRTRWALAACMSRETWDAQGRDVDPHRGHGDHGQSRAHPTHDPPPILDSAAGHELVDLARRDRSKLGPATPRGFGPSRWPVTDRSLEVQLVGAVRQDAEPAYDVSTTRNCPATGLDPGFDVQAWSQSTQPIHQLPAAATASASVGHRPIASLPRLRASRSVLVMIGAGSATEKLIGPRHYWSNGPLLGVASSMSEPFVAEQRFRALALALLLVVMLSMLGPRSSLTDMSGSTASSHSQHRQPSASPTSSSRVICHLVHSGAPFK